MALDQLAYRWRNDDGSESAATWRQAENAADTISIGDRVRLRVQVDATGDPDSTQYQLEARRDSGPWYVVDMSEYQEPILSEWGSPFTAIEPGATEGVDWDFLLWGGSPGSALKVGSTYYLYYVGSPQFNTPLGTPEDRAIGVVTSSDGKTWTKYGSNPIVTFTTGGSVEEGATNPVVLHDGSSWHMWYSASRDVGGGLVDVEIHYRTSTDGLTWTGDVLEYGPAGEEYLPVGAFIDGTTYYVYYIGNLTSGAGPLNYMQGATPGSLGSETQIDAGPHRVARQINDLSTTTLSIGLRGSSQFRRFYRIERSTPGTLGPLVESYQQPGNQGFSAFLDASTLLWSIFANFANAASSLDGHIVQMQQAAVYEVELDASPNIAASGEATTAQLSAPAGKTTADFVAGRIQDDENPADAVDIPADDYTELEWSIKFTRDGSYEFRITANGTPLDSYTQTPNMTVTSRLLQRSFARRPVAVPVPIRQLRI